jgi:hypothetical protein
MIIRSGRFVSTTNLGEGKVAMLKNGLVVIGVANEMEAQRRIFKAQSIPQHVTESEDTLSNIQDKISAEVSGQLSDSVEELYSAFLDHLDVIEKRAFEAGYYAAKKEECSVATTEHSDRTAL